ncbi:hypothetical protein U1Q18_010135 [Sarracenia purpurea var. burkii]
MSEAELSEALDDPFSWAEDFFLTEVEELSSWTAGRKGAKGLKLGLLKELPQRLLEKHGHGYLGLQWERMQQLKQEHIEAWDQE